MKDTAIETPTELECEGSDAELSMEWQSIDWQYVEKQVGRLQSKISKAISEGKKNDAMRLAHLLTRSFTAKALAVKTVSENNGSKTPGIDGVLWNTDAQKMRAVKELNPNGYKSRPLRRVEIPKKNGKKRPLGIPTMHDRAMQTLFLFALDPISEATSDGNSYGFRKGRSCQDACERIFLALAPRNSKAEWILEGDIRGCFDNISHQWLMDNIPMEKRILAQFLKSGYVFNGELFPTEDGTPQGGAISPTLANMTLNGMQPLLERHFGEGSGVTLVRYADDFVVACPSEEIASEAMRILVPFLSQRGLELSEEKTIITRIDDGFDFLGFNFRRYNGKLIIKPSKESFESIKEKVRDVILSRGKASTQAQIIMRLNPIVRGWCNYFHHVCSKKTFSALHDYIYTVLRQWAHRRHSRRNMIWVMRRYWHKVDGNDWVFSCKAEYLGKLREFTLYSPKEMSILRHVLVRGRANPYIDMQYFAERQSKGGTVRH